MSLDADGRVRRPARRKAARYDQLPTSTTDDRADAPALNVGPGYHRRRPYQDAAATDFQRLICYALVRHRPKYCRCRPHRVNQAPEFTLAQRRRTHQTHSHAVRIRSLFHVARTISRYSSLFVAFTKFQPSILRAQVFFKGFSVTVTI